MGDIPKKNFSLLKNVPNIVSLPQSTIDTIKLDEYDINTIHQMLKLLLPRINHFSTNLMEKKLQNYFSDIDFVRFRNYPLVATFNEKTNRPIVNVNVFGKKEVSNIENRSLYSAILYAYLCKLFTLRPLKIQTYEDVSLFLSNMIMKIFGKKYGIMASYEDMIPKLQFIITSYVLVSFYNQKQQNVYSKASKYGASIKDFNVDINQYDLSDSKILIKLLSESGVFPGMLLIDFVASIVNRYGVLMIPFFEDEMRFMATLGASSMATGGLFPPYIEQFQKTIYIKLIKIITNFI